MMLLWNDADEDDDDDVDDVLQVRGCEKMQSNAIFQWLMSNCQLQLQF